MKQSRLEPYLDVDLQDLDGEVWESVFGLDGYYLVSNLGRIKSERRLTTKGYYTKEVIRKQQKIRSDGHHSLKISFCVDGVETQRLVSNVVAESFGLFKNELKGDVLHHKNLNRFDCRLENLCILSRSQMLSIYAQNGYMEHLHINNEIKSINKFKVTGVYEGDELVAKICTKCLLEKKLDEFPKSGHTYCRECELRQKGVVDVGRNRKIKALREAGLKKCYKCQLIKKIDSDFYKGTGCCKVCKNIINKQQKASKPILCA